MEAIEKRCYYEVLGLPQDCTQDDIRSSYKKLALQRHPDKLIQSGLSSEAATSSFQELVRAYEVLSDPKERSWYDSHRSQILFSNPGTNSDSQLPDLFSFFSPSCYTDYSDPKTGFYKVYGDVFDRVYGNEVKYCRMMGLNVGLVKEAPLLGDLRSEYGSQVSAFYGYWLGFSTVMDFGWVVKYDVAGGENRKVRRVMEEENRKVRKKARKEFNDTVRGLAEFVKKRDKRVVDMMVRKEKERERKREEERERRKVWEREKAERARRFQEPEWTKVDQHEEESDHGEEEEEEEEMRELYCAACGKKFKSEKQWRNHEQSRKHKEKVAQLRKAFVEEDEVVSVKSGGNEERNGNVGGEDEDGNELEEKFEESVGLGEGRSRFELLSDGDEEEVGVDDGKEDSNVAVEVSDDEVVDLEAMISGRRNKKQVRSKNVCFENNDVGSEDELGTMEYNNKKGKKKSRRAKKEKGKAAGADASRAGDGGNDVSVEENNGLDASDVANNGKDVDQGAQESEACSSSSSSKAGKQPVGRKDKGSTSKRDTEAKPKKSSKGKKQKEKSKDYVPVCEKCGEEFDSRNQLHKHLSDTGHASLKSR